MGHLLKSFLLQILRNTLTNNYNNDNNIFPLMAYSISIVSAII
jgi:hypothetical protein